MQLVPIAQLFMPLNNEAHDSVGGQPTKGSVLKFSEIAKSFGYESARTVLDLDQLSVAISNAFQPNSIILLKLNVIKEIDQTWVGLTELLEKI